MFENQKTGNYEILKFPKIFINNSKKSHKSKNLFEMDLFYY